ncbi:MAG: HIT domain-containing protein [Proteobacteria bacterium]|nr:HIT domain-containing protein [Pseudomonadota bacterium]
MQKPSFFSKDYDDQNVFAKILKGEVPCRKIYEDSFALAFYDVSPKAPTHALVIPKKAYICFNKFIIQASNEEVAGFFKAVGKTIELLGVSEGGFRLISNSGEHSGQEVPHFHVHILGGEKLS